MNITFLPWNKDIWEKRVLEIYSEANPFICKNLLNTWLQYEINSSSKKRAFIIDVIANNNRVVFPIVTKISGSGLLQSKANIFGYNLFDFAPIIYNTPFNITARIIDEISQKYSIQFNRVLHSSALDETDYQFRSKIENEKVALIERANIINASKRRNKLAYLERKSIDSAGLTVVHVTNRSYISNLIDIWYSQKCVWVKKNKLNYSIDTQKKFQQLKGVGMALPNLQGLILKNSSSIAAIVIGGVIGGTFYYYMTSYDHTYAKHSPSTLLLLKLVFDIPEIHSVDLMWGEETYKKRFASKYNYITSFMERSL